MAEEQAGAPPAITTRRTYVFARVVALSSGVIALILASMTPALYEIPYLLAGLLLIVISSGIGFFAFSYRRADTAVVLSWLAPADLVALGLLVVALHNFEDPVYPAMIAAPIFYAFVIRRREAMLIALGAAFVYSFAHAYSGRDLILGSAVFLMLKTLGIVFVGGTAVIWAERNAQREEIVEKSKEDREMLNDRLQQRLAELQAVSEITDIIHSSLDFDRVGPLTLEILTKVLGIDACALFVIDKRKSETLFSASVGVGGATVPIRPGNLDMLDSIRVSDGHFSCLSVLDHRDMMVVFCSEAGVIDAMAEEDKIVLQAVASELVVAVENSRLYKLTRTLAITDELTGLNNYRYLQQRLDEEIERARRYHKDLSLLMIDVDDFKGFNDRYGHIAGDVALSDLALVFRENTREVDIVTRYGGEEFSIVLPETDAAGAFVVAEKIREAVSNNQFKDADGATGEHLTISVGLGTFPTHAEDKEVLLRQADDALYKAKHGGKDRVRSPMLQRASRDSSAAGVDGEEI